MNSPDARVRRIAGSLLAGLVILLTLAPTRAAVDAKLIRYPHYHAGRLAFTYLGDVWTANEKGENVQRITVNRARDVFPRFSPDGRWIAFSSDRSGNLDVYLVSSSGGTPKQLTSHSADDTVLAWAPDSKSILFASNRAEDFTGKLYTVGLEGGMPDNVGADMGIWATYSPDGTKLAINRHGQVYWRKYYRGSNQTDVVLMDIAAKRFTSVTDFKGLDSWPMWGHDGFIYFVSDRESGGLTNVWRVSEKGGTAEQVTTFKSGDVRWPAMSADGKVITFEHDFGAWKLDVATRKAAPIRSRLPPRRRTTPRKSGRSARKRTTTASNRPDVVSLSRCTARSLPRRQTKGIWYRSPTARRGIRIRRTHPTAVAWPTSRIAADARRSTSRPPMAQVSPRRSATWMP